MKKHKTVIYVQHIANNEGATFFLPDTLGVQIHDDVQPIANERVLQKTPLLQFFLKSFALQSISYISNYIIISGFPSSLQCIFLDYS